MNGSNKWLQTPAGILQDDDIDLLYGGSRTLTTSECGIPSSSIYDHASAK
jgi:hypothetical protein